MRLKISNERLFAGDNNHFITSTLGFKTFTTLLRVKSKLHSFQLSVLAVLSPFVRQIFKGTTRVVHNNGHQLELHKHTKWQYLPGIHSCLIVLEEAREETQQHNYGKICCSFPKRLQYSWVWIKFHDFCRPTTWCFMLSLPLFGCWDWIFTYNHG